MMKFRLASPALDGRTVTLIVRQDDRTAGPLTVDAWGPPPPPPSEDVLTVDSAPAGMSLRQVDGDAWQVSVASGPYAANSPYPFSRAALDAAALLELAVLPTTGGTTAGSDRAIAADPLVIGLASAGAILQTREWKRGGTTRTLNTSLTHTITAEDVTLGLSIAFHAQNDEKAIDTVATAFAAAPFEPLDETTLGNWIDVRDAASFSLGTATAAIKDKSGNGRHWNRNSNGSLTPTRSGNRLVFTGATAGIARDAWYQITDSFSEFLLARIRGSLTRPITAINGSDQNYTAVGGLLTAAVGSDAGTDSRFVASIRNATGVHDAQINQSKASDKPYPPVTFGDWHVVEIVHTATLHQVYVDGVLNYTKAYALATVAPVSHAGLFGVSSNGINTANNAQGDLAQYVQMMSVDPTKRSRMRAWFAARRDELIAGGF